MVSYFVSLYTDCNIFIFLSISQFIIYVFTFFGQHPTLQALFQSFIFNQFLLFLPELLHFPLLSCFMYLLSLRCHLSRHRMTMVFLSAIYPGLLYFRLCRPIIKYRRANRSFGHLHRTSCLGTHKNVSPLLVRVGSRLYKLITLMVNLTQSPTVSRDRILAWIAEKVKQKKISK